MRSEGPDARHGVAHGGNKDRKTWLEQAQEEEPRSANAAALLLIIGGGQGGIALGARLKRLGVPTIVVEKNARAGDSWRNRYKSLCLHDPVWYDHMPYLPFPDTGRCSRPKTRSATGWRRTPRSWSSTTGPRRNARAPTTTTRAGMDGRRRRAGQQMTLRPKQLVLATGMSGNPNGPKLPGTKIQGRAASFQPACRRRGLSRQALHRDRFQQLRPRYLRRPVGARRRRDHDPALIHPFARSETLMELALGPLYSEEALAAASPPTRPTSCSPPSPIKLHARSFKCRSTRRSRQRDADFYERLAKGRVSARFWRRRLRACS